jgi:malate synthase
MTAQPAATGAQVHAKPGARQAEILSSGALAFLADLHRAFDARRLELLARRNERQTLLGAGQLPHFLTETRSVR